jgi:hypothetical protein
MTLDPLYLVAAVILRMFCLDYSVKNSFADIRFVRPQLSCANHSSTIRDCYFLFLLVFSICLHGHSLLSEANSCAHELVTNGAVV